MLGVVPLRRVVNFAARFAAANRNRLYEAVIKGGDDGRRAPGDSKAEDDLHPSSRDWGPR